MASIGGRWYKNGLVLRRDDISVLSAQRLQYVDSVGLAKDSRMLVQITDLACWFSEWPAGIGLVVDVRNKGRGSVRKANASFGGGST